MDAKQWEHWASNRRKKTFNILAVLGMNSEYVVYAGTYHKNYEKSDSS